MATAPRTKITRQDLKIYPAERLTQTDDGGGMPQGNPLTGALNELFKPIGSVARLNGAFYAVLEYMGVLRPDDEPLIAPFACITRPPNDLTVSYLLFKATRFGESRAEILKRIEAYNVATIESKMILLSTQSKNSRIIQVYQRVGESLPMVGDRYCLDQNKAGYAKVEQYVQITRIVKAEDRTFTNAQGNDFKRTVIQMEISTKLKDDFIGANYPSETYIDNPCKVRDTAIADAAQFYGVKPLVVAVKKDARQIRINGIMEKLVPTNQIAIPLIDLTAAGQTQTLFDGSKAGADGLVSLSVNKYHGAGTISTIYFGNAITPNSVAISGGTSDITDKGGMLYLADKQIGTIDYANGFATVNEATFAGYFSTAKFRPASSVLKVADTARIPIDINNRSSSYTFNLDPIPAVGTLQVSYLSQGEWYTLKDDGSGVLRGASAAHGSGNISLITGSGQISLQELPDVGSAILLSWGTRANYFNRSNIATTAKMLLQLSQSANPASLTLTWQVPGANNTLVNKTATCNAAGVITGDWTGYYNKKTRQIRIDTGANFKHPVGVLDIIAQYSTGNMQSNQIAATAANTTSAGKATVQLPPSIQGSVEISWNPYSDEIHANSSLRTLSDDGNGNLLDKDGVKKGTINYQTWVAEFDTQVTLPFQVPVYQSYSVSMPNAGANTSGSSNGNTTLENYGSILAGYTTQSLSTIAKIGGIYTIAYFDSQNNDGVSETLNSGTLEIDLLPNYAEVIAPSSINFKWGGKTYFDKSGSLYTDLNPQNGAAIVAGTIDYSGGKAILTNWTWTDGANPVVTSLVTSIDGNPVDAVTFRTPTSPILPGGLKLRATATDGTKITASTDYNGNITGAWVVGKMDFEFGVADVRFGKLVTAAGHESESWYNADQVKDGKIWQPLHVFAESIIYNADAVTYLPIDSSVVKIDTVRLPPDGRVPIFRRGDDILIRNAKTDDLGSAFAGGQTIQLSRTNIERICLVDSNNKAVNAELWDYDLDAGSITFKTTIDLSSYQMPLKAHNVWEQRNRIIDLDIDGTLSLQFKLNHDYPLEDTYVSGMVIFEENLAVWHSVPFTQKTWTNVWQDTPVGEQLLNKLNLRDYPMVLTDDGAITERWMFDWLSSTQFNFYGEASGYIGKFDILTDFAPINPATGNPYMWIDKRAFGGAQGQSTWSPHDVIRVNTRGTLVPVWVLCAVQPNPNPPTGEDGFEQYLFGDTTEIKV